MKLTEKNKIKKILIEEFKKVNINNVVRNNDETLENIVFCGNNVIECEKYIYKFWEEVTEIPTYLIGYIDEAKIIQDLQLGGDFSIDDVENVIDEIAENLQDNYDIDEAKTIIKEFVKNI